jgi:hypothetical protein
MKKITVLVVLVLALELAMPVNAIFRTKKVPVLAPVTKTNYVACTVVGAVALVIGIGLHMLFHSCPEQSAPAIDKKALKRKAKNDTVDGINTVLDNVDLRVLPLGDTYVLQAIIHTQNSGDRFQNVYTTQLKDFINQNYEL